MTTKKIKPNGDEAKITLSYGGDQFTRDGEVHVKWSKCHFDHYFDGPALRDALLEAFPLTGTEEPAEPEFLDVVPGCVVVDKDSVGGYVRVCLPDGRYYNVTADIVGDWHGGAPRASQYRVAFDPRGAKPLPNPLDEIRVGDRVRRVAEHDNVVVTTEFTVAHIDGVTGYISPTYGLSYRPDKFEVVDRETPDRLPAGTITRMVGGRGLWLTTERGHIDLQDGYEVREGVGPSTDVREGVQEVIYLP